MDELRRKFAALRIALSPDEIKTRSALAAEKLAGWLSSQAKPESIIGLYRNTERNQFGEANPSSIADSPALALHHFAFPRITDRFHREMDYSIPALPEDWVIGQYGIPEPLPDLPALDPASLDFVVVPAVIFGARGERIGRGGGFYDRYLPQCARAVRIGFGFDFQLVNEPLPQATWDAKMDIIITDLRVIETSARQT